MECKLCSKESEYLEVHHIIPKSRGGLDNDNNLINICVDCHSLVHDVGFKGGKGVISTGIKKNKLELIEAQKWCDENMVLINNKMDSILEKDIFEYQFISYLMLNYNFDSINLKEYTLTGSTKIRLTL
jgi:hypothetical protein